MSYFSLFILTVISFCAFAQQKTDTIWKKEKEMLTFKIRPKPVVAVRNRFIPPAAQGLTLNEIFNQYRLTLKPSKNAPKNLQAMLDYSIEKCCVGYAINNMIRDYDSDWERGVAQIRTLYLKQNVVFEKLILRAPDGRYFYIRKIIAVKTG